MWRAIEQHLASRLVGRITYGAIIGLAVVVVMQSHPEPSGVIAGTLIATALAVALAELYSEIVGVHARTRRLVDRRHFGAAAREAAATAAGAAFPAVFFIPSALGWIEIETAFSLAKWSGLGLISFYGFCAARLSGAGWTSSVVQSLAVASIGALLIAFKALVH